MKRRVSFLLLGLLVVAAPLHAEDGMQEKIRLLEQEIQELKKLQAQQSVARKKTEQCLRAVGRESLCKCIGEQLPAAVNFEQYIHTIISSKEELGYEQMSPEQKQQVEAVATAREKCGEKGFFK